MKPFTRRNWLAAMASAGVAGCSRTETASSPESETACLDVADFQPKSMLHVPATSVPRSRFPVIDIHTHLTGSIDDPEDLKIPMPPDEVLGVMDRKNIRLMADLTGGHGKSLERALAAFSKPHPNRFVVFTEPHYSKASEPDYPQFQADQIKKAVQAGARGLKVLKTLGLFLRDGGPDGPLVKVDDPRFDPMWEVCAALHLPVTIHTSDPEAFFLPIDRFNERWEELHAHPNWSFHGRDFPPDRDLQEARFRVLARHPKTTFVVLHMGDAENLACVAENLDKYPNMHVEFGARIGELGRQPRTSRRFFDKYQDRILFGTDAVPHGDNTPQQVFNDQLYEIYYRFLETGDEYFDYAPARVPPQGRWKIYGIGLPDQILKKVYCNNAARLLGLQPLA